MASELKLISTEVFFAKPHIKPNGQQITQMTVLLPVDAISYAIQKERGNPHSGYEVHFRKNYFVGEAFQVKDINPAHVQREQIDLIK